MGDGDEGDKHAGRATRKRNSTAFRAAIWQAHGRRCAYTGQPVEWLELEIDHIIPLSTPQPELEKLKAEQVIDRDFDLNGSKNLLPTSRFQNSRKRDDLRNRTALLHFLSVAAQYHGAVEAYFKTANSENQLLNAYLKMKAHAEINDLTIEDIIDVERQQAEGITRLRHDPEFGDIGDIGDVTALNAQLARELMNKPFAFGGGSVSEIILHGGHEGPVSCRDCASFLIAKDRGLWPETQFDINCFGMADRNCEMLRFLQTARFAPASLIRYPRITFKDLDRWSSQWVTPLDSGAEIEPPEDAPPQADASISDLIASGNCSVLEISDWNLKVQTLDGFAMSFSELFRADLDGDGSEEILVYQLTYATAGTFRSPNVSVGKPNFDGLIYPLDRYKSSL